MMAAMVEQGLFVHAWIDLARQGDRRASVRDASEAGRSVAACCETSRARTRKRSRRVSYTGEVEPDVGKLSVWARLSGHVAVRGTTGELCAPRTASTATHRQLSSRRG